MNWKLWIDDDAGKPDIEAWRNPPDDTWKVARSSRDAITLVIAYGAPSFIDFDHDLGLLDGQEDTAMIFCRWLENVAPSAIDNLDYRIHSANPDGRKNIDSFMKSWKKSRTL